MKTIYLSICVLFCLFIIQCKSKSNITSKEGDNKPAVFMPEEIGLNEVKVQGELLKENGVDYFIIDKVLLRGRSVPVISAGQKIKLHSIRHQEPVYNKLIKGFLRCKSANEDDMCLWSFKPI